MNKRRIIIALVGLNVILLAAIGFTLYTPPSALAQAVGAHAGSYLIFGGRADVTNDAIYLLDGGAKRLHVFRSMYPRNGNNGATAVGYVSTRDLTRDFLAQPGANQNAAPQQQGAQP